MKAISITSLGLALAAGSVAYANPWHPLPRQAAPPAHGAHTVGVVSVPHPEHARDPKTNPPHEVIVHDPKTNKDEHHTVITDHRPWHVIDHDPRLRVVVRGYHPVHDWGRFHYANGGWWHLWGITAWDTVGTVTCEAANETTGALYPVSEDRDATGWDDGTVNAVLDQALDDCFAEAAGAQCGPITPACSFQPY
jgi:hypothetical protein